jgi:membrane fusion protein (multidrug efflux system)
MPTVFVCRRRLAATAGLALLAGLLVWAAPSLAPAQDAKKAAGGRPPVAVEAAPVEISAVEDEVKAIGSLRANEQVVVRPEIAGRITQFLFEEGARVEKGAVLVRIDDAALQAELAQANTALTLSKRNFDRAQELFRRDAASTRARDEAQAKLDSDRANLELARTRLAKTQIRAPFAGTIGLRLVSVGAYVSPGQDIVDLVNADPIKVDFSIPERFLPAVKVGQSLDVTVDAYPEDSFAGEVYAVAPQIDQQGRALALRARIANPAGKLKPGLFARVRLITQVRPNAVVIPEQAVFARNDGWFVFTVVDGKAKLAKIATGIRRAGKVEVVTGLKKGDVVVSAGHIKLREGAPVKVLPVAAKPAKS